MEIQEAAWMLTQSILKLFIQMDPVLRLWEVVSVPPLQTQISSRMAALVNRGVTLLDVHIYAPSNSSK